MAEPAATDRREQRRRPRRLSSSSSAAEVDGEGEGVEGGIRGTPPVAVAACGDEDGGLADRLTVIVTTSPVRSNPDTYIIRRVLASFGLVPGLEACRKLIVCDGFQVAAAGAAPKYKKGKICAGEVGQYKGYVQNLRALAAEGETTPGFQRTEVHPLPERHGFAGAVQYGCGLARTPYVLVVQHDRAFIAGVDLRPALAAMDAHPEVRYIGLRTAKTRHVTRATVAKGPVRLRRLWFWYDSTHLCRTSHYRSLFHWRFAHFLLSPGAAEPAATPVTTTTTTSAGAAAAAPAAAVNGGGSGGDTAVDDSSSSSSSSSSSAAGSTTGSDDGGTDPAHEEDAEDGEEDERPAAAAAAGAAATDAAADGGGGCGGESVDQERQGQEEEESACPPSTPEGVVPRPRWRAGGLASAVGEGEGEGGGGGGIAEEVMGKMTFGSRFPQWAKVKRLQATVLKKGQFIEDTFGQLMLTHLQTLHRQEGLAAANAVHERRYGAYMLVVPLLQHSNPLLPTAAATPTAPDAPATAATDAAAIQRGRALMAAAAVAAEAAAEARQERGRSQSVGMVFDGPPLPPGEEVVEEEVVAHLDGRDYLTSAQLRAKGLEPWARKGERQLKRRSERQAEVDARLQADEERRAKEGAGFGLSFEGEEGVDDGGDGGDGPFSRLFGADE